MPDWMLVLQQIAADIADTTPEDYKPLNAPGPSYTYDEDATTNDDGTVTIRVHQYGAGSIEPLMSFGVVLSIDPFHE